jgi:predicted transcriptional regulator
MKSTIGRPRALTDRQVKIILAWHVRYLVWRALRNTLKSQRQLARELGVSQATISHVIRVDGEYKQVAPERRAVEIRCRRRTRARLRRQGLPGAP